MSFLPIKQAISAQLDSLAKYDPSQKKQLLSYLSELAEKRYPYQKPAANILSTGGGGKIDNLVNAICHLYACDMPANGTASKKFERVLDNIIGPQSVALPNILFLGFKDNRQHLVQKLSTSWEKIGDWTQNAINGVGKDKAYSQWFGGKSLASKTSYLKREAMVSEKLSAIQVNVRQKWTLKWAPMGKDVASRVSDNFMTIGLGMNNAQATSENITGILIHEIGHNNGLEDVCELCRGKEIKQAHFQTRDAGSMKCNNNNIHSQNGNHYTGSKKCKKLVSMSKNSSVWNTDNYRWYCYFTNGGKSLA